MISLTLNMAFLLYLGIGLFSLTVIGIIRYFKERKKVVSAFANKVLQCEFCAFNFLIKQEGRNHKCPQCHSFIDE